MKLITPSIWAELCRSFTTRLAYHSFTLINTYICIFSFNPNSPGFFTRPFQTLIQIFPGLALGSNGSSFREPQMHLRAGAFESLCNGVRGQDYCILLPTCMSSFNSNLAATQKTHFSLLAHVFASELLPVATVASFCCEGPVQKLPWKNALFAPEISWRTSWFLHKASENLFRRTSWYRETSGTWICTFNWRTPQAAMLGPRQSQGWIHQASHLDTLTLLSASKRYPSEWTTKTQSCEHGNDTATVYDYMSLPAELLSSKLCWALLSHFRSGPPCLLTGAIASQVIQAHILIKKRTINAHANCLQLKFMINGYNIITT